MDDDELAGRFEEHRDRLTAVAYRILGSASEADRVVQEAWTRVQRSDRGAVHDPVGWLTGTVARVCLDVLRSRTPLDETGTGRPEPAPLTDEAGHPEHEAMLSESLAAALLVVLETLAPAERVAFVLHDLFATPYDEIGLMLGRSPAATRQLASRARRRVQAPERTLDADRTVHGRVVEAFLAASRTGDVEELVWLLHPDAVLRADRAAVDAGAEPLLAGADAVAGAFAAQDREALPALLDGFAAAASSDGGRLRLVVAFTVLDGRVTEVELIADPAVLATLDLELESGTP